MIQLPAICQELRIRHDGKVAIVNSRDIAERFNRRPHYSVLESIRGIKIDRDRYRSWFRDAPYFDAYGREQPSFDLTRQGFSLLVFGWNDADSMAFKVSYIEAFDAMEAALQAEFVSTDQFLGAVREIVAPLVVRFDGQDVAIGRLENQMGEVVGELRVIKGQLVKGWYRKISDPCKRRHVEDVGDMKGLCPCCRQNLIVADGVKLPFAQFDHFHGGQRADDTSTWLICTPCHTKFTNGTWSRDDYTSVFSAYQKQRQHLPGRQGKLFG